VKKVSSFDGGKLKRLREEIVMTLCANQDQAYGKNIRKLVRTDGPVTGVRVPKIRDLVKDFATSHKKDLTVDEVAQLLDGFWRDHDREGILFGVFLLSQYRRQIPLGLWGKIDKWVEHINNWETCDQLAMNLAGELVAKDLSLVDDLVQWARSDNFWRRRFAAASTTTLNQKARSHAKETFRVCELLLADKEPMVQKAVAWAIREVAKNDEIAAFSFLKQHKNETHPRILKEASAKLTPPHRTQILGK
jgi:3-methyladenine DNA glycosylase AlkD